jgi:hypothetical protein
VEEGQAKEAVMALDTQQPAAPMKPRQSVASRRVGYGFSVAINAVMLVLINAWPGWDVLPFLTQDFSKVLGLVNASIAVGLAVNVMYLVADPVWFKALGDLLVTAVGIAAMWAMWRVFPFDFGAGFPWETLVRIGLILGLVGSGIAIIVQVVTLTRANAQATKMQNG